MFENCENCEIKGYCRDRDLICADLLKEQQKPGYHAEEY